MTEETDSEWEAWQLFVKEFRRCVGDLNDDRYNGMVCALRLWGEELVQLRSTQPRSLCEKARMRAIQQFYSFKTTDSEVVS